MGGNRIDNTDNNTVLIMAVLLGDLLILNLLYYAFLLNFGCEGGIASARQTMLMASVVYLLCTSHNGVVLYKKHATRFKIAVRVIRNILYYAVLSWLILWFGEYSCLSFPVFMVFWLSSALLIILYRFAVRKVVVWYRSGTKHIRKVAFVGSYDNIVALYNEMVSSPYKGYEIAGYFDDEPNDSFPEECKYIGKPSSVTDFLSQNSDIQEVYCCLPSVRKNEILPIINYCIRHLVHFYSVPNVTNYLHHRMFFNMFGSVPYLSLYREPLSKVGNRMVKRLFDVCFSLVFLVTLFPIILIVVSIITKLTMPGPIFFKQLRSGINGKEFYCLKFRSMKVNDQADTLQATRDDPRKTKWGNIMRKTNIDEFPQFINVLLGQMSVVGPRPHMVKQTEDYSKVINEYMVRHYMKPGITGWSQVTGYRGETKELSQMEKRVDHDIWYMEHWSFSLDLYIIYKTVANIFTGDKNAY